MVLITQELITTLILYLEGPNKGKWEFKYILKKELDFVLFKSTHNIPEVKKEQ